MAPLHSPDGLSLRPPWRMLYSVPGWIVRDGAGQPAADQADFSTGRYWSGGAQHASLSEFFAANGSAFTRASTATYRSATPLLASAAIDVLRFQHDAAGIPLGVLLEGARTNICTARKHNPTDLTNVAKFGANAANAVLSLVDDPTELAASGLDGICTNGKVYKLDNSIAGSGRASLSFGGSADGSTGASLQCYMRGSGTGSIQIGSTQTTVTAFPSSYTLLALSVASTVFGNGNQFNVEFGGIMYVILPCFEMGVFPSSHPISGDTLATVTRAIDAYTQTVTASATGAIVIEGRAAAGADGNQVLWQKDDGTAANRIRLVRAGTSLNLVVTNASVDTTKVIGTLANGADFKVALRWRANDFAASLNGAAAVTEAGPAVPAGLTNIRYGRGVSAEGWFGTIKSYARFDNDNVNVAALTA